jgi:hypothetical protein
VTKEIDSKLFKNLPKLEFDLISNFVRIDLSFHVNLGDSFPSNKLLSQLPNPFILLTLVRTTLGEHKLDQP